jgi:hypothetical protein
MQFILAYFSLVKSWRNIETGFWFNGDLQWKNIICFLNETHSYNDMDQSEIQKEKIVPVVLMDWHLPQMSLLLKPYRPDNGNFSVIEA